MKNLKKIFTAAIAATMLMFTGCGKGLNSSNNSTTTQSANNASGEATQSGTPATQSGNTIIITLDTENAPITCENFEKLVNEGFYDGLTFHRVVDGFMAQGGDPEGTGTGGSKDMIKGEFSSNGVDNKLSHKRGVVSMARSNAPDSASSQFFICYVDCAFLDGSYAAFGNVTEGMEVVDDFTKVERTPNAMNEIAVPTKPIVMEKVEMIEPDENGAPRVKITMNNFIG